MVLKVNLEKKKKKFISSHKRNTLHKLINIRDLNFEKNLNKSQWFINSRIVASFISIKSEISTKFINNFIEKSGKVLCLPIIEKLDSNKLNFKEFKEGDVLLEGKFGVKEPQGEKKYLPDILFIPCLAFDKFGYRLGYGGGYYDKTISYFKLRNHSFTSIGLAYDDQKIENVPHDKFDQKLNYILTEKRLYKVL